jgi:hypothetical protein
MNPTTRMLPTPGLATLALVLALAAPTWGDELSAKLRKELAQVKGLFDERNELSVAVGDFTVDPELESSGGAGIANAIIDAFKEMGLRVDRKARLQVEGKVKRATDAASGLNGLLISMVYTDKSTDTEVLTSRVRIFDPALLVRLGGGTGDLSGSSLREQNRKADTALTDPSPKVDGSRVSAAGAGFAVEILVKKGGEYQPRGASVRDGLARVTLTRGEIYGIRLINGTDRAAAVELAVDGLNIFALADSPADRDSRVIVDAGKSALLIGWYRNSQPKGSNEFLVGLRSEAAALKQLPAGQARVGMVTATFSVAWPANQPPPPGEQEVPRFGDGPEIGTKVGDPTDQRIEPVDFKFGKPKAAITVRYDQGAR